MIRRADTRNIYDPFFTTKGRDKGTGLGLAMVYGIMAQNNGNVQVRSELGKGSRFRLLFPRSTEVAPTLKTSETVTDLRTGSETILFVEDEGALRQMHSEFLGSLGYRLLIASDGVGAIALFKKEEKIDLLITDVIMPNMGGIELSKNLK